MADNLQPQTDFEYDSLQKEYNKLKMQNDIDSMNRNSENAFESEEEIYLAIFQLKMDENFNKIHHFLSGDKIVVKNGNKTWEINDNEDERPFSKFGVNEIMTYLEMLVNKHKLLSTYTTEEMNIRLEILSDAFMDYIYINHEDFGMNTKAKKSKYEMIHEVVISLIEDAYRRALGGVERETYRKHINIHQNIPFGNQGSNQMQMQTGNRRRMFKPSTWFG